MDVSESTFHLIVVADLAPGSEASPAAKSVDKDSLDSFLQGLSPRIEVALGGGRCEVSFREFRDFRPERLALQVPALSCLLRLKQQLKDAASGGGSVESLRASLATLGAYPGLARALEAALESGVKTTRSVSPPPPTPRPPLPTGDLYSLVDVEGTAAPKGEASEPVKQGVARLIDAVLGSEQSSGPSPSQLRAVASRAESEVAPLLRALLHASRFRELESAWRGLRLLVRSIDFRAGCRLHVIPSPRSRLSDALREVAFGLADDLRRQGGTCCLLLDYSFDGPEEELLSLTREAAVRSLPVLASAGLKAVGDLSSGAGEADRADWERLRSEPASRWLSLATNRFLLRNPYGAAGDTAKDLAFEELTGSDSTLPWGRPAWLLGAFVAASVARTGWGTEFAGRDAAEAIEPLPLRPGDGPTSPLESDLTEEEADALGKSGLIPLGCRRGHDRPFAAGTATVHQSQGQEPSATLRSAFFAARIGAAIESLLDHLDLTCSLDEIARTLGAALGILGTTVGGSDYVATAVPTSGGSPRVSIRIRPQGGALRGLPELVLEVPITLR